MSGRPSTRATGPVRYVALGDSYTIGTALANPADRWPNRLVAALAAHADDLAPAAPSLELVANLGVNGFTSGDVIRDELPALEALRPGFASLLVGVNDVVRNVPAAAYETNAAHILDDLLARLPAGRIVTVATPDYTVTPQGAAYGEPATQAAGIRANNATLRRLASARAIAFVDIHDLSLRAGEDPLLIADDGLHPSGVQYALWVERIAPVVEALLRT